MDYVLLQLGNPGRYQLFIAFLLCCLQIPISFSGHLWSFYFEQVPHRCYIPVWQRNGSNEAEWIPREVNSKTGITSYSQCEMYLDSYSHWRGTSKCTSGWEYRPNLEGQSNPIIEWDLVCDRKYLVTLIFYASNVSSIVGGLIGGLVADRFERKPALLLALYLFVAIAFSMHFVQDLISFAIAFCLQSLFLSAIQISSYVLLLEIMPSPYQLQASLYYVAFGIVSSMFVPLLMWLIASWRYIQLALSAPGIVFFAHLWILPRSPLWLISEGKMTETENLMENLSKQNGKTMPPSFRLHLQNFVHLIQNCNGLSSKRHSIWSQFSFPSIRWYLLCHFYFFFVTGLSYHVTDSQVLRLHETRHADYFYRGLMDLGAVTLIYHISLRIGPRPMQSLLFISSGLLMMIAISLQEIIPKSKEHYESFDYRLLIVPSTLVSGARTLMMILPIFIWYHTVKTLPTGVRAIGFAFCYGWTVVGYMSASNLLVLADLIAPFIPIGLCGSLSMIAGGLSLLFPDFWRKPLPTTLSDIEHRSSSSSFNYYVNRSNGGGDPSTLNGLRSLKSLNPNYLKSGVDMTLCSRLEYDPKTEAKMMMVAQSSHIVDCHYDNHEVGIPHHGQIHDVLESYDYNVSNSGPLMMTVPIVDPRSSIVLSDTHGSQLTEIDDMVVSQSNWHLFSPNDEISHQHRAALGPETNRSFRDLSVFPISSNGAVGGAGLGLLNNENSSNHIMDSTGHNVTETKL